MATMVDTAIYQERKFPGLPILILLAVAAGAIMLFASSHANSKHGNIAEIVDQSCRMGGLTQFLNPTTKRVAIVTCVEIDGEKKFGVGVYEKGQNVTAFLKDKMKTLDQVVKYLTNAGYVWK